MAFKLLMKSFEHVFKVHGSLKDGKKGYCGLATMFAEDESPLLMFLQ